MFRGIPHAGCPQPARMSPRCYLETNQVHSSVVAVLGNGTWTTQKQGRQGNESQPPAALSLVTIHHQNALVCDANIPACLVLQIQATQRIGPKKTYHPADLDQMQPQRTCCLTFKVSVEAKAWLAHIIPVVHAMESLHARHMPFLGNSLIVGCITEQLHSLGCSSYFMPFQTHGACTWLL
jgi:hypothetical protein